MVDDPFSQSDDPVHSLVRLEGEAEGEGLATSHPKMSRWGLAAAAYSFLVTVIFSTFVIARGRAAAGLDPQTEQVLLWQAANYGLWVPVAAAVWFIFTRQGPLKQAVAMLAVLGLVALPGHAFAAVGLEMIFSLGPPESPAAAAGARLPIDLLVYTAICTAAWALSSHARSSELAQAPAAARSAATKEAAPAAEGLARIFVSIGSRHQPVDVAEIEWIGAAANYAVIHWDGREGLVRETLKTLEKRLNPDVFVRVHRSTIANLAMVESASSLSDGSWRLVMKSGDQLVVSRTFRDQILERLGRRAA